MVQLDAAVVVVPFVPCVVVPSPVLVLTLLIPGVWTRRGDFSSFWSTRWYEVGLVNWVDDRTFCFSGPSCPAGRDLPPPLNLKFWGCDSESFHFVSVRWGAGTM
jgi:hypothetical protein